MLKEELQFLVKQKMPDHKKLYWSRRSGHFVNKLTGQDVTGASFTGTIREWYEILVETLIDAQNMADLGKPCCISVSPEVLTILQCTILYKPYVLLDGEGNVLKHEDGTVVEHDCLAGTLSNRMRVYKNVNQPRNRILLFSVSQDKFAEVVIKDMDII